ncbi:SIS domain-containing protein [Novosphingobium aerophilum]|uniref:SIS domain-containing protein n=1 Tax=Novosphingobium TaxID=165696 RepID=UPI002D77E82B|nr:SIS domain-containing protein [Novosphingobium sp. RL4]WRT95298.1 SIS domain-containing protein [Novosphingobium sp. RL4]
MQSEVAHPSQSLMARETAEAPQAVRAFLARNQDTLASLAQDLRGSPPSVVVTCARGSSDNAATYAKYLIETLAGVPVSSSALSVSSVFGAEMQPGRVLVIAISQSGRSPDLLAAVEAHRRAGARVVALVNDETAPLADLAQWVLPLHAGPEKSVAATKSYIASLAGVAAIVAQWTGDAALTEALGRLPDALAIAAGTAPFDLVERLSAATNLFVIARGYGFGIAQEGALKLKETCGLHAEAYSAAEVRHGPMTIINEGFPIVAFATSDASGESVRDAAREFAGRGAQVALLDAEAPFGEGTLAALAGHAALEPLLMIQSFYPQVNALSLARGLDPDNPAHLRKVTETL